MSVMRECVCVMRECVCECVMRDACDVCVCDAHDA